MKKKILLLMGIFLLGISYAQVGINTQSPLGIFHLDELGDTSGSSNIKDDIIIASDGATGVNVSVGGLPVKGASIALHSVNKGFVPNVVKLKSTQDISTVPNPTVGMVVYNAEASGVYPNNTLVGYYLYNGTQWQRLRTQAYLGVSETRTLKTSVTTSSTSTTATSASVLDFGDLTIFEDGAYAFSFNIYATSSTTTLPLNIAQGKFYIHVLKKGVDDSVFSLFKTIEVDAFLFPNGASFSLTGIAGMELKAQDQLKFTTRHNNSNPSITYTSGATYMMYWML